MRKPLQWTSASTASTKKNFWWWFFFALILFSRNKQINNFGINCSREITQVTNECSPSSSCGSAPEIVGAIIKKTIKTEQINKVAWNVRVDNGSDDVEPSNNILLDELKQRFKHIDLDD